MPVLFRKLGPNFTAVVKRHQPYEDENTFIAEGLASDIREAISAWEANRPLGILRELSNFDKHRLLLPRYAAMADATFTPKHVRHCSPKLRAWQSGALLVPSAVGIGGRPGGLAYFEANPVEGREPHMDVDFDFWPSVDLGGIGDAQEVLDALAVKVLRVIREFEPLF